MKKITLSVLFCLCLVSCGGGSSGSGVLIEGTLTQVGAVAHSAVITRHGVGEHIENVSICALGECSVTDAEGQFGFLAPATFTSGEILITVNGHGIDSSVTAEIPDGAGDVFLKLGRNGQVITIEDMLVDGQQVHQHSEGEPEHSH